MMKIIAHGFLIAALSISNALADPLIQKLRGNYEAKIPWKISLSTIAMGENDQTVAAQIVVADKGCSGAMSALGASDGNTIKVRLYMPSESTSQSCEVSITLDKSGTVATISEESCLDFTARSALSVERFELSNLSPVGQ
jgi:hypothetical protein